jgi:hypothetical protein
MGTRSIITFKSEEGILQVYKHWDGYPDTTVPELQEFLKWNGHRNNDVSYTMANYVYWHKNMTFEEQKKQYKDRDDKDLLEWIKSGNSCAHTGLGILPNKVMNFRQASEEHNAEYFYVVDLDQKTIDEEVTEKIWSFTNKKGKSSNMAIRALDLVQ